MSVFYEISVVGGWWIVTVLRSVYDEEVAGLDAMGWCAGDGLGVVGLWGGGGFEGGSFWKGGGISAWWRV